MHSWFGGKGFRVYECCRVWSIQGVDLEKLISAGEYICEHLGRRTLSRVAQAHTSAKSS